MTASLRQITHTAKRNRDYLLVILKEMLGSVFDTFGVKHPFEVNVESWRIGK